MGTLLYLNIHVLEISPAFTPTASLAGGLILGGASSLLLATHGKILGISGILYMAGNKVCGDRPWRLAFISGLCSSAVYLAAAHPGVFGPLTVSSLPLLSSGSALYAIAGFAVGLGTKLGSGCTSGHGLIGLARFSRRSFTAVMTFMASAAATIALTTSLRGGPRPAFTSPGSPVSPANSVATAVAVSTGLAALLWGSSSKSQTPLSERVVGYGVGVTFGLGLGLSGMLNPHKVMGFLWPYAIAGGWDPSLALVMGGGVVLN